MIQNGLQKCRITKVTIKDTKKDGSPNIDKNGKPFKMVYIQTDTMEQNEIASCYCNSPAKKELGLNVGDEVELVFERSGNFLNFSMPSQIDQLRAEVIALTIRVNKLEGGTSFKSSLTPEETKNIQAHRENAQKKQADWKVELVDNKTSDGSDMPNFDLPTNW